MLHLSTALCPLDRGRIVLEVERRLAPKSGYGADWTLVATSLVEAGVNRHGNDVRGEVIDVQLNADGQMVTHPGAAMPASVLGRLFESGRLDGPFNPTLLVTQALCKEVGDDHGKTGTKLATAEADHDYPQVSVLGRLIGADTVLVVVDAGLGRRLENGATVSARELLGSSVQIWSKKIDQLGLNSLKGRSGVYIWKYRYDPDFLGYMAGALRFSSGENCLV